MKYRCNGLAGSLVCPVVVKSSVVSDDVYFMHANSVVAVSRGRFSPRRAQGPRSDMRNENNKINVVFSHGVVVTNSLSVRRLTVFL